MTPREKEKIATKAGWKFHYHDELIFTAKPPADLTAPIHAEISQWIDAILAAKAFEIFPDHLTDLFMEVDLADEFEVALQSVCKEARDVLVGERLRRTAGLLGHEFALDPEDGSFLVLTPSQAAIQKSPEYILFHHDAMHLELMRRYVAAFAQEWFVTALQREVVNIRKKAA